MEGKAKSDTVRWTFKLLKWVFLKNNIRRKLKEKGGLQLKVAKPSKSGCDLLLGCETTVNPMKE